MVAALTDAKRKNLATVRGLHGRFDYGDDRVECWYKPRFAFIEATSASSAIRSISPGTMRIVGAQIV